MRIPDSPLPISEQLPTIAEALRKHHQLVLEAPPGAGKTTSVPLALINEPWRGERKIIMLEPRRVAARAAAARMADLLGEKVGETVGYTVRLDSNVSSRTVIEVVTEGVLTRRLQQDPELANTALIIFDEFHERSIHSDLGLALCLQARELFRDNDNPLKLLVMSATLNGKQLSEWLSAPLISSEGRCYPVEIHYGRSQPLGSFDLAPLVTVQVLQAMTDHSGSILVFLPGQREINLCLQQLQPHLDKTTLALPMHGGIPLAEQQAAIAPLDRAQPYRRKIVFATDIAETSLTIDGVTTVIDSGLARKPCFDPRTGMTRLDTRRISRAASEQRAGRAGRQSPGNCYRLWSKEQQSQLQPYTTPEILQADLAALALQLLQWGVTDPKELTWLEPPPVAPYQQALDLLRKLNAVSGNSNMMALTDHGECMARLPVEPRLAHMLIIASQYGRIPAASELAAILSERVPLKETDIENSLKLLHNSHCPTPYLNWQQRVKRQAQRFQQQLSKTQTPVGDAKAELADQEITGFLLASAFPDRIARKRPHNRHQYQLSNGRSACLRETDPLAGNEWLAVAELGGRTGQSEDIIYLATPLSASLFDGALSQLVSARERFEWREDRLQAEQQKTVGEIVIHREPLKSLTRDQRQQAVLDYIRSQGLSVLPWTPELRQWQARVNLLHQQLPDANPVWPNVSDQQLLTTLDDWLGPYLHTVNKRQDLNRLPLKSILEGMLTWPLPQQLNELAPTKMDVPSGSRLAIDYSHNPPILEVKLQEMFGCRQTPAIANGRVKLVVHLLSPARRPLQITQDLEGFWDSSYHEIKKEMKGRYPKHPWPDNPWEAQATRYTKNRQNRKTS